MEQLSSLDAWIASEFNETSFGDQRLDNRFVEITRGLAGNSEKNISSAFDEWKDIKACYRFFSNEKVTSKKILDPHRENTLERIRKNKRVLFIQDTVVFSLGDRPGSSNLCFCSKNNTSKKPIKGLILHGLLAVADNGLPLGIVQQQFVDRKSFRDKGRISKTQYQKLSIEEKESVRWQEFIKFSNSCDTGNTEIIHVADREGDIYELYRECALLDEKFLIRASHNRDINKSVRRGSSDEKLFDSLEATKAAGVVTIRINSSQPEKKFRKAKLTVIYKKISMPPPHNRTMKNSNNYLPMVKMTAIMAIEKNPPKNESPLKWVLLTNLHVDSLEGAIDKVQLYSMRWNIELLHKIMKSGFAMEKAQLRDGERLKKYITLKSVLSWRIFWITRYFYESKSETCELAFSAHEWKILYRKNNSGSAIPKKPPKLGEVYHWLGKLGGFIGRKGDGDPGFISIWRGWMRFTNLLEDYDLFCG